MTEFLFQQQQALRQFRRTELRRFVPLSVLLFLASLAIGAGYCLLFPEKGAAIIQSFIQISSGAGVVDSEGRLSFLGILKNNWTAMLFIAGCGLLPFLFLPALALCRNGILIGVLLAFYHLNGLPVMAAVAGILPHGVFELPALALAGAAGLFLCRGTTGLLLRQEEAGLQVLLEKAEHILRLLLLELFPLVLIAALVVTYVTPLVRGFFL